MGRTSHQSGPNGGSFSVIGAGRAGGSLIEALGSRGWECHKVLGAHDVVRDVARDVDVVFITTPDQAIASVAEEIDPVAGTVVAHLAGSLGTDVLGPHQHRGAVHPLVALPAVDVGARRLLDGAWFAVGGSSTHALDVMHHVVTDLGGTAFEIADADRARYHAAACIASNHLVALLGQVERIALPLDVPLEAFLALASTTVDSVAELGPRRALTGPVARSDWGTVAAHVDAIGTSEQPAYIALAALAWRLGHGDGSDLPIDLLKPTPTIPTPTIPTPT